MSVLDALDDVAPVPGNVLTLPQAQTMQPPIPYWDKHKPALEALTGMMIYSVSEVEDMIRAGRAMFFPTEKSAVITEITIRGDQKCMECIAAVGDMEDVTSMAPGIEALARSMGCEIIILEGRKGWEKMLKPSGYEFMAVSLRKSL